MITPFLVEFIQKPPRRLGPAGGMALSERTAEMHQQSIIVRFWKKVDTSAGPDACWPWTGARTARGYGRIHTRNKDNREVGAHRIAWEIANGPVPDGLWVLHRCDNPSCVNPAHLFLGNQTDNMQDASRKARLRRGEHSPGAKLTVDDVREIRASIVAGESRSSVARRFGINVSTARRIVLGLDWKHVDHSDGVPRGERRDLADALARDRFGRERDLTCC